jgi:hypothetical protein
MSEADKTAAACPRCRHDFRAGPKPPEDEEAGGRMGTWLVSGFVLAAVAALAFVFLFGTGGETAVSAPALPPTASAVPDSEIGEALANFDSLTEAPAGEQK